MDYIFLSVCDVWKMLKVLRSSIMNMVTQIIYLGRVEVGDWEHTIV